MVIFRIFFNCAADNNVGLEHQQSIKECTTTAIKNAVPSWFPRSNSTVNLGTSF